MKNLHLIHERTAGSLLWFRWRAFFVGLPLLLSVLVSAQSTEVLAKFQQANEAMRAGNFEAAAAGFAAVVKQAPDFAEAHFNLGLVNEEQGQYDGAIVSFERAVALKPHLHGANLFLGITEFRLNHLEKAHAAIVKETVNFPKDAAAWMWLGIVCLGQDKAEEAAEALDKAAKLKPDDEDILYHRGRAHLLVSKNSYARMFKVDPGSWRVHRVLAQANAEADRHVEAIAEYEAAIKLAPTQPGLHEELGSEYRNVNKIAEAEQAFQRELEIDPHNVLARYKLGAIAVEQGDGAKGKELIEAALREKPGLVHADYNLGRAEMLVGEAESTAGQQEKAAGEREAAVGQEEKAEGEGEAAVGRREKAIGKGESAIGRQDKAMGEYEAAAAHLEKAAASDPDPEVVQQAWYQLGTVYRKLHRIDEAKNAMAMFQKLKDEAAQKSQQSLEKYRAEHPNSAEPQSAQPNQ